LRRLSAAGSRSGRHAERMSASSSNENLAWAYARLLVNVRGFAPG